MMNLPMHRNRSVMAHDFSMNPRADVPRSTIRRPSKHLTTFDSGYLIPIFWDRVFPGDSFNLKMNAFCRLNTPTYPIMDNLIFESFFFYIPLRILWDNFKKFMGEQKNPADSISFIEPYVVSKIGGYDTNSLQDYYGLPIVGQIAGVNTFNHSALPIRAYHKVWNYWFRDENLQNSVTVDSDDGPDLWSDYVLLRRGKRHDYFTSCLPWPQKGATGVTLPLGTTAPLILTNQGSNPYNATLIKQTAAGAIEANSNPLRSNASGELLNDDATQTLFADVTPHTLADLSSATAATINAIRLAFATQKLLERDARGGTRYPELINAHFGVQVPDYRVQEPEYLGGGSTPVNIDPVPQTGPTGTAGSTSPLGELGGVGAVMAVHGFSKSFVEHGIILGLVSVRADLTYQQGLDRMWSYSTRYDYYFPAFAHIGEQAVLTKEIYIDGSATDDDVFGYVPHWDELRYKRSMITGQFNSRYFTPLDAWHLSQNFGSVPTLNSTFIEDHTDEVVERAVAVSLPGTQWKFDGYFDLTCARPIPVNSIPGFIDRF